MSAFADGLYAFVYVSALFTMGSIAILPACAIIYFCHVFFPNGEPKFSVDIWVCWKVGLVTVLIFSGAWVVLALVAGVWDYCKTMYRRIKARRTE